ncbi:MAG: nitrate/nitrite transporter, partial [Thermomicrobiales bacterium]
PLLMGTVKDATGSYAIGFMLLSEFALLCLIVNILVLQRRAALLDPTAGQAVVTPDAASMSAPQNTSLKKEKAS